MNRSPCPDCICGYKEAFLSWSSIREDARKLKIDFPKTLDELWVVLDKLNIIVLCTGNQPIKLEGDIEQVCDKTRARIITNIESNRDFFIKRNLEKTAEVGC